MSTRVKRAARRSPPRGEPVKRKFRAGDSVVSNSPFDAAVIDLEAPVAEAAAEEVALVDGVGRVAPEGRLGQEFGVKVVDPAVERIEQGQRAPTPFFSTSRGVESTRLAVFLDRVEVDEVLERNRGPPVLGEQRRMKLAANVHATAEPVFRRHSYDGLLVFVLALDFSSIAGVAPFFRDLSSVLRWESSASTMADATRPRAGHPPRARGDLPCTPNRTAASCPARRAPSERALRRWRSKGRPSAHLSRASFASKEASAFLMTLGVSERGATETSFRHFGQLHFSRSSARTSMRAGTKTKSSCSTCPKSFLSPSQIPQRCSSSGTGDFSSMRFNRHRARLRFFLFV